eukprot:scaffold348284_cov39-Attheya_sp.AAC.1
MGLWTRSTGQHSLRMLGYRSVGYRVWGGDKRNWNEPYVPVWMVASASMRRTKPQIGAFARLLGAFFSDNLRL